MVSVLGKKIFRSSSKVSLLPDCVYKCTAGVQPPAIPKQSQEIEILLPVTDVPSFESFIIDTPLNRLYPLVSTIVCAQYIFIPASLIFLIIFASEFSLISIIASTLIPLLCNDKALS